MQSAGFYDTLSASHFVRKEAGGSVMRRFLLILVGFLLVYASASAVSNGRTNTSSVNVRAEPYPEGRKIDTLVKRGTPVTIYDQVVGEDGQTYYAIYIQRAQCPGFGDIGYVKASFARVE